MGSIRPSNIKRIAEDLVNKNPGVFNTDFSQNRDVIKKETRTKKEIEEGTIVS